MPRTLRAPIRAWAPNAPVDRPAEIAVEAHRIAIGFGMTRSQRADAISHLIERYYVGRNREGLATATEIRAFVEETLVHREQVATVGRLRGYRWNDHDLEGGSSKFNPKIASGLAKGNRDDVVIRAMKAHNRSTHHALWNSPSATMKDLAEPASDIVSAWRQHRSYKKAWSFSDIEAHLVKAEATGQLSGLQIRALRQALKFQHLVEHGAR